MVEVRRPPGPWWARTRLYRVRVNGRRLGLIGAGERIASVHPAGLQRIQLVVKPILRRWADDLEVVVFADEDVVVAVRERRHRSRSDPLLEPLDLDVGVTMTGAF